MSRAAIMSVCVFFGCSADVSGLESPTKTPTKTPPGSKPPVMTELCAGPVEVDDTLAVARLGLITSNAIVEGRLGDVRQVQGGMRADLEITKVWLGASFLEGTHTSIALDQTSIALPGAFVIGLNGNAFPTPDDGGGSTWWNAQAIVPASQRSAIDDLLVMRRDRVRFAAVAQIVGQEQDHTVFRVLEPLVGELPPTFAVAWSTRAFVAPFPGAGEARYVVALDAIDVAPGSGMRFGDVTDLRPETDEARARVIDTTELSLDGAALADFAREYKLGWTFHRAPEVALTTVSGMADECCTNVGGTYVRHLITTDLRRTQAGSSLLRGGHGFFPQDRACGVRALLAFEGLGEPVDGLDCNGRATLSSPTIPVAHILAELTNTTEHRAQVDGWLAASDPQYRLHPSTGPLPVASLAGELPWTTPLSVERAVVAGPLVRIHVVDVADVSGHQEVTLATQFVDIDASSLTERRVRMAFTCGDSRLLRKGTVWLAPTIMDRVPESDADVESVGAFLVPGVLFPDTDMNRQAVDAFVRLAQQTH